MELKPLAWYKLRDVFEKITGTEIHLSKGDTTSIYWGSKYVSIRTPMGVTLTTYVTNTSLHT